jgi:hypothetical protein
MLAGQAFSFGMDIGDDASDTVVCELLERLWGGIGVELKDDGDASGADHDVEQPTAKRDGWMD